MKTLTEIIAAAIRTGLEAQRDADDMGYWDWENGTIDTREFSAEALAEHVAAAYREARTITTREQLDSLPLATIIYSRFGHGCILEKSRHHEWGYPNSDDECALDVAHLPALVLWLPEDDS